MLLKSVVDRVRIYSGSVLSIGAALISACTIAVFVYIILNDEGTRTSFAEDLAPRQYYILGIVLFVLKLLVDIRSIIDRWSKDTESWRKDKEKCRAISRSFSISRNIAKSMTSKCDDVAPYYSVERFHFEDFKGIKNIRIDIPPGAPWVFLTGENGYGKTVFLQAIAISLYGRDASTLSYIEDRISRSTFETAIVSPRWGEKTFNPHKSSTNFPFVNGYGVNRTSLYSESSTKEDTSPITNLFDPQAYLRSIETRLLNWQGVSGQNEIIVKRREVVRDALLRIMEIAKIEIMADSRKNRVLYYEKDGDGNVLPPATLNEIASGYRAIVGLVGDIFIRFYDIKENEAIVDPREFKGIVIIDELELHFHPKWQMRIPTTLSSMFPQIQFIVSTHSPMPLLGAPKNSVFLRVDRNLEDGITIKRLKKLEKDIKYLLPNSVLTSDIFDMDEIEAVSIDDLDKVNLEDNYEDIESLKQLNKRLMDHWKGANILPDDLFRE